MRYCHRLRSEMSWDIRILPERLHVQRKLPHTRHPMIAIVFTFHGPLDRPFHYQIAGYRSGSVIPLKTEPVKGLEYVCFILVDVPARPFLLDEPGNIASERTMVFSHLRAPVSSIPTSPIALSRILWPSVARYSSTVDSSACPRVEEIIDTGFPAARRCEANVLLAMCSPLTSAADFFRPRIANVDL